MSELSVIIVSYNVKDYLRQCLRSVLRATTAIDAEIIVVDNDSSDGSAVMVTEEFPGVTLVRNPENAGFARANNQGLLLANSRYVALVNPDTLMQDETFQVCLDFLDAHPDAGVVGCRINNPDTTLQRACRRSYPTPWVAFTKLSGLSRLFPGSRLFGRYNVTYLDENEVSEVEAISGSFMVVRQDAVQSAGYLDESFFMYGEDLDWCYRIREQGWKIVYLPHTQIIHYKGKSSSGRTFANMKMFYDAMYVFVKKHFTCSWIIPGQLIIAGIWCKRLFSYIIHPLTVIRYWLADCAIMQLGLAGSLLIRFGDLHHWMSYLFINAVYTLIWTAVFSAFGMYGRARLTRLTPAAAVIFGLVLNAALTFFFPQFAFSRQVLVTAAAIDIILITGWRFLVFSNSHAGGNTSDTPVILAGGEPSVQGVAAWISDNPDSGRRIQGSVAWNRGDTPALSAPLLLGSSEDIPRLVREHRTEEIIFPFEKLPEKTILLTLFECRTEPLIASIALPDPGRITGFAPAEAGGGRLVSYSPALYREAYAYAKRTLDLLVSVFLLPVWCGGLLYAWLNPAAGRDRARISNGGRGYIDIRRICRHGRPAGGLLAIASFLPAVISGKMSICGTAPSLYRENVSGYGCKPGIIDICSRSRECDGGDRIPVLRCVHDYVYHYSIATDYKLLLRALFPRMH